MRGSRAKKLRSFAIHLFEQARKEPDNEDFCRAAYMLNPKNNQIICAGYRGVYRFVKKMYRNNMEVMA